MGFLSRLFGGGPNPIQEVLQQGAVVIDVRTVGEFKSGHVAGSLNIPLDQVSKKMKKIKQMNKPVVFCCASGMRSAQATGMLKNAGIESVYNGRTWGKVDRLLNN